MPQVPFQKPGCGGALIAPDIVLMAADCEDRTGQEIVIGAYESGFSTFGGAQIRTCTEWVRHPKFLNRFKRPDWVSLYNFAVCKLDSVVTIDDTEVLLELNRDDVPVVGEELYVLGMGWFGRGYHGVLNRGLLVGEECDPPIGNHVCAIGLNETVHPCFREWGGPLVRVVPSPDGGPDTHYHVGLVAKYTTCGTSSDDAIYGRTSVVIDWIDETMCELGSVAAVGCDPEPPAEVVCVGDRSTLVVSVETDQFAYENEWVLEKQNGLLEWEEVETNALELSYFTYVDTLCLEPDSEYRWTMTDTFGDGLCWGANPYDDPCGTYSVTLNGDPVLSDDGSSRSEYSVAFLTPDDPLSPSSTPTAAPTVACVDEDGYWSFVKPDGTEVSRRCAFLSRPIRRQGEETARAICGLELTSGGDGDGDGTTFGDKCKAICATVGAGPCA